MMYFDDFFNDVFESFKTFPNCYTIVYTTNPTESKEVVNAIVDSPLAFNLITNSDKDITLEIAMAGVKKSNLKITRKNRTFTITCLGVKKDKDDKKVAIIKNGLKVPSEKDIVSNFNVPETFDVEKTTIDYTDGLLTISVPLKEEEKPCEIKF